MDNRPKLTASLVIDYQGQLSFSASNSEAASPSEMSQLHAHLGTLEAAINHCEDYVEGGGIGPAGDGCAYAVCSVGGLISAGAYGQFSAEIEWDIRLEELDDEFFRVRLDVPDNQPELPIIALTHGVPHDLSDDDREALIDELHANFDFMAMAAECARRSPRQIKKMEQQRNLEVMKNEH